MELGAKLGFKPRSACSQSQFTFHSRYQKWVITKFSWENIWHGRERCRLSWRHCRGIPEWELFLASAKWHTGAVPHGPRAPPPPFSPLEFPLSQCPSPRVSPLPGKVTTQDVLRGPGVKLGVHVCAWVWERTMQKDGYIGQEVNNRSLCWNGLGYLAISISSVFSKL